MDKLSTSDIVGLGFIISICLVVIIYGISYLVATVEARREMKSFYRKQKQFNNDVRSN